MDVAKSLETYAATQWFDQLYSLYHQDAPENLIWYLDVFQDVFETGIVAQVCN